MNRRILLPLVILLTTLSPLCAQTTEEDGDGRSSLAAELGWAKFRVSAGRLTAVSTGQRNTQTADTGNPLVGIEESLRVNATKEQLSVRYELSTPQQRLVVEFLDHDVAIIERRPLGDSKAVPLRFNQPHDGPLQLAIGDGEERIVYQAGSFWHLLLSAPQPCHEHLLPILSALRPGWHLEETAGRIEDALVRVADSGALPDRSNWQQLVEQLGSARFSERRAAERQLREAGPAVVAYLRRVDLDSLDAERRVRISRLLESLSSTADDTPQRIATWLIDNPTIWLAILQSEDASRRRTATAHLSRLLDRPIDFDPDADAAQREKQLSQLRRQLP